ncbi:MAG: GNAT family N-acetyltransferase [Cyanobacteria bacterium]|nr:GNAT family N-acetyltransferase [Cyanobacteriota bacterium]
MVQIRPATEADIPVIGEIFNHYVATSTCTFQVEPESAECRLKWFTERTPAHPVTVAVDEAGEVIGWAALSPWKGRCAYAHSVEASVYVRHDRHRRGVGRLLLEDLLRRAREHGHRTVIGGACTEQAASLALQERLGFTPVGVFRQVGFKFGRWLDVAYTQLLL